MDKRELEVLIGEVLARILRRDYRLTWPPETARRFLRRRQVEELSGLSCSAIYKRMEKGTFPKPFRISGRRIAWLESDVVDWMRACMIDGYAPEGNLARPGVRMKKTAPGTVDAVPRVKSENEASVPYADRISSTAPSQQVERSQRGHDRDLSAPKRFQEAARSRRASLAAKHHDA